MGERKVLNKYYPPDFDPATLPRNKRAKTNDMKVRMMLPMSVRCRTCGNFMYKGTKFNTRKEDVVGETYLGIQVFRFYWRCTSCAAEFTMKTDPEHGDYTLEQGASRNYEPWRDADKAKDESKKQREEEEMGNAMKALENKTLDSKREMDVLAALDEMRTLKAKHAKVTTEAALDALMREAQEANAAAAATAAARVADEDEDAIAEFISLRTAQVRRVKDSSSSGSSDADGSGDGNSSGGFDSRDGSPEVAERNATSTDVQPSAEAGLKNKPGVVPIAAGGGMRVLLKAKPKPAAAQQAKVQLKPAAAQQLPSSALPVANAPAAQAAGPVLLGLGGYDSSSSSGGKGDVID